MKKEVKNLQAKRRPVIGVFGSAGGSNLDWLRVSAQIIGREIAKHNCIMVTGGCPGIPHEAALAATEEGGIVLGFSPEKNEEDHVNISKFPVNPYILIFTGMGKKGRNIPSVRTCQGAIFISGRTGTLNEFSIFYDEATDKHVMGLLQGSGGMVDSFMIPYLYETEKKSAAKIVIHKDPGTLVGMVYNAIINVNM